MSLGLSPRLGVNIDHIATLRQARGTRYPDPVYAAMIAQDSGADGITLHLREDRRHIQPRDVELLKQQLQVPMNLEMAITEEMLCFAESIKPEHVCLVPEKREELTTEGGLEVAGQLDQVKAACARLQAADIEVSLFIDADQAQIDAAKICGAPVIELHTGCYADAKTESAQADELNKVVMMANYAYEIGFIVNAGHGLHYHNVLPIAEISVINELNIGHSIIAKAALDGLANAVAEMKALLLSV